MLAIKQTDPPVQFKPEGIGDPLIGVRILIKPGGAAPILTPEHNRVGTKLLGRLLQACMELAGVHVTNGLCGFPLNRAFLTFAVSELAPAQHAVKEELEKLGLLEEAQIAWRDPREEIWRVLYSKSAHFDSPSDEELADERQLFERLLNAADKSKESGDEPSVQ
jgi:hypothetical protein